MAITKTVIDDTLSEPDGFDAQDITGNGLDDLLVAEEDGEVYWYEQTTRGVFKKHIIRSSAVGGAKQEGAKWWQLNGIWHAVTLDQKNDYITLFTPDENSPRGTWSSGNIITSRPQLQDCHTWDIDGDGVDELVYSWEGRSAVAGGINWLDYNSGSVTSSGSYTDYEMTEEEGAWWIVQDRLDLSGDGNATDILFSARDNGKLNPGIYWIEEPSGAVTGTWAQTTIESNSADWLHIDVGDFFGNGNNDIVAQTLAGNLYIYDAANSWARTEISSSQIRVGHNVRTSPYKRNGRNKIITSGYSPTSAQVYLTEWYWDGDSWAVLDETINIQDKIDDSWAFINITSASPLNMVAADSVNGELAYFTFASDPESDQPNITRATGISAFTGTGL